MWTFLARHDPLSLHPAAILVRAGLPLRIRPEGGKQFVIIKPGSAAAAAVDADHHASQMSVVHKTSSQQYITAGNTCTAHITDAQREREAPEREREDTNFNPSRG